MIERLQKWILAGVAGEFSSPEYICVLTFIWCPFHSYVTAVAHKIPLSFCQMSRWRVTPKQAYILDPMKSEWADYAAVQALCGNLSGNELTCKLSGNIQTQLSQLAEPLWTDSGIRRGTSVCKRISALENNVGGEWMVEHSPKSLQVKNKHQLLLLCYELDPCGERSPCVGYAAAATRSIRHSGCSSWYGSSNRGMPH